VLARNTVSADVMVACAFEGAEKAAIDKDATSTPASSATRRRIVMIPCFLPVTPATTIDDQCHLQPQRGVRLAPNRPQAGLPTSDEAGRAG